MKKRSKKIVSQRKNLARGLLFINAILWFIYCVYIYYDMAVVNNNKTSADIATVFLFVIAALMLVSGIMIGRQPKRTYYPALIIVILNTILVLTNLSDVLFMAAFVLDLSILSLLFDLRKDYLSAP